MDLKTKKIISGVLTGLVAALFLFSASGKLLGSEEGLKMASSYGLTPTAFQILGVVELVSVILFVIPRTGVLGTMLLTAYLGGAIATHLEHAEPIFIACVILAVLWLIAIFRFPELKSRLLGSNEIL